MFAIIKKLAADKKGVTAIEYGLIAALISVTIIGAVGLIGTDLQALFNNIATALPTAPAPTP
jgi:pilus assembly protein Flp/PilA